MADTPTTNDPHNRPRPPSPFQSTIVASPPPRLSTRPPPQPPQTTHNIPSQKK
ncbi:formin-like protein 5 isoform X1 [Iris pallida]|uniref:Formin-like protein 5 isoform X1 n=1 Tax=Iris pallida TaxID=29817 RepID=A0AAX6EDW4_IRIPA|nr:formin-like protein 5 isoform X1 [Iris pallida]